MRRSRARELSGRWPAEWPWSLPRPAATERPPIPIQSSCICSPNSLRKIQALRIQAEAPPSNEMELDDAQSLPIRHEKSYSAARRHTRNLHDSRRRTITGKRRARHSLEEMGTLPLGAPLGHRARRLQRERRRLELFVARSGKIARVPVGRRRHRRFFRPPPARLFRARTLERKRPDTERKTIRANQFRG